eukprot:scaffold38694_cov191-Amphora_coffeaeformis.AAC.1
MENVTYRHGDGSGKESFSRKDGALKKTLPSKRRCLFVWLGTYVLCVVNTIGKRWVEEQWNYTPNELLAHHWLKKMRGGG